MSSEVGVVRLPRRSDWPEVKRAIAALVPGKAIAVPCPYNVDINNLRSAILTAARRMQFEEGWKLRTRTVSQDRVIHCFLSPLQ